MSCLNKCKWCEKYSICEIYHDNEWGIPLHNDVSLFEILSLIILQCGLNMNMILSKRKLLNELFDNFDFNIISKYNKTKIESILNHEMINYSQQKINAVINNANKFIDIINEFGSYNDYLWKFTDYKTLVYKSHKEDADIPITNDISDKLCDDLKARGFKHIDSIIIYHYLQACGLINDHNYNCDKYHYINKHYPVLFL